MSVTISISLAFESPNFILSRGYGISLSEMWGLRSWSKGKSTDWKWTFHDRYAVLQISKNHNVLEHTFIHSVYKKEKISGLYIEKNTVGVRWGLLRPSKLAAVLTLGHPMHDPSGSPVNPNRNSKSQLSATTWWALFQLML